MEVQNAPFSATRRCRRDLRSVPLSEATTFPVLSFHPLGTFKCRLQAEDACWGPGTGDPREPRVYDSEERETGHLGSRLRSAPCGRVPSPFGTSASSPPVRVTGCPPLGKLRQRITARKAVSPGPSCPHFSHQTAKSSTRFSSSDLNLRLPHPQPQTARAAPHPATPCRHTWPSQRPWARALHHRA